METTTVPNLRDERFKIKGITKDSNDRTIAILIENISAKDTNTARLLDSNKKFTEERVMDNFGNDANITLSSANKGIPFNQFRIELEAMKYSIEKVEVISNNIVQKNMPYQFQRTWVDGTQLSVDIYEPILDGVEIDPHTDDLIFNILPATRMMVKLYLVRK